MSIEEDLKLVFGDVGPLAKIKITTLIDRPEDVEFIAAQIENLFSAGMGKTTFTDLKDMTVYIR